MTIVPPEEFQRLEQLRLTVRRERHLRNWTAQKLAEEATKSAKKRGFNIKLKQYSIASLETGRLKSEPIWVRYIMFAFADNPVLELSSAQSSNWHYQQPEAEKQNDESCSGKIKLPDQSSLRNLFLGLLIPVGKNVSLEAKQHIADVLAQRLPKGLEQISLFQ
ncbi:MAG: hypothetical protein ABF508_09240 [Zymomonas mobilis]|uniref:Uncharacterized protein n=1 Tax=Zymomonas mobilis TaxID=542 RepID=A0A542VUI9_ZYMMB|nr:hypothetical protein [Zymomonas mobilis]TQL14990.1 hypothetical protein FBY58_1802 [Zymomonas mobilis]